jgi:hypothetical protein
VRDNCAAQLPDAPHIQFARNASRTSARASLNSALIRVVSTDYPTRMFYAKSQPGFSPSANIS